MLNAGSIIKCCEINGIRNDNKYIDDINCMKEEEYDMRHLIDPKDLSVEETGDILALAERIRDNMPAYSEVAKGKKIATLFYEPSTRTRLSFETAMLNLGGTVIGFPSADVSSVNKGETVEDTIRVISCYADIVAMRHPKEGAPMLASLYSRIPVINAGDGGHSHPTQTMIDLMTIKSRKGRLDNLTVGLCGDLKFGRTVHSLVKSLSRYEGNKYIFISPQELKMPDYMIQDVLDNNTDVYKESRQLESVLPELDVLYMTRVQKERFFSEDEYIRLRDCYILNAEKLKKAPKDMPVLHPLPRITEIAADVDKDVVLYKDRLLRFGFELIEYIASLYNCEIEIIDNTEKSEQQELVEDLVQIITVFSCKLQGKRANKAKKLIRELIQEETDGKSHKSNVDTKQRTGN